MPFLPKTALLSPYDATKTAVLRSFDCEAGFGFANETLDRILALLDRVYDESDVIRFQFDWKLRHSEPGVFPFIGFFDSSTLAPIVYLRMDENPGSVNRYEFFVMADQGSVLGGSRRHCVQRGLESGRSLDRFRLK